MTVLELSDEQAALYILFVKYYDTIGLLISRGVFDIRPGNAILSFDEAGRLKSIKKETFDFIK